MKKARKKRKARKLLERAWASLEIDRLTMPGIGPAASPLALAGPRAGEPAYMVGHGTPRDERAFPWVLEADGQAVRLDQDLEAPEAYQDADPEAWINGDEMSAVEDGPLDLPSDADAGPWVDERGLALDPPDAAPDPRMDERELALARPVAVDPAAPEAPAYADRRDGSPVAGTTPDARDPAIEGLLSSEGHDDAADPTAPLMRSGPLAVRGLNNGTPQTWARQDGDLARKTLLTAGPDAGSWVGAIAGTSNATADITFNVYLGDGRRTTWWVRRPSPPVPGPGRSPP